MPAPANRVPVVVARGTKANLDASLSDIKEGEIVLANDEDVLYTLVGGVLVAVGGGGGGATSLGDLDGVSTDGGAVVEVLLWNLEDDWFKDGAYEILPPPAETPADPTFLYLYQNDANGVDRRNTVSLLPSTGQLWLSTDNATFTAVSYQAYTVSGDEIGFELPGDQSAFKGAGQIYIAFEDPATAGGPIDGQVLTWVAANSQWEPVAGGATSLGKLTDVDTTGQSESTANFLRLSNGVYVPSAANIKNEEIVEISKTEGLTAESEMLDTWETGDFNYLNQAEWEAAGYTYVAGSGTPASKVTLTDTDFPFDPSAISTTWATGTYLGVAISPTALWTISSAGSLCIANDGVSRVQDYNRQFNSAIYNTIDLAIQAVYEPGFAGVGIREVIPDQQWVVRMQVTTVNDYAQNYGYIVEYIFNADGSIRCNAAPTNKANVTVTFWASDNRSGVNLSGNTVLGTNGFGWREVTPAEAHSTLVAGTPIPFNLTDFGGIDVTGVAAGDMAQFDANGNIAPGHDALKKMTDISPNVPLPLVNVEKSTGGFFDVPESFRFFYGGNSTDPFSGDYTVSGTSVYFDDRGSAFDGSGTYLLGPWFRQYVTGSSLDFWFSTSTSGPWTKHTATGGLIEQVVDDTYRLDGVSTSGSLSSSGYFAFVNPAATGYNDGDVLAWSTTDNAWITRGKIDTDDFKALVAASTDFADFQTRVAAIPSYRS